MPDRHKTPVVGWHPPADLLERLRALIARRNVNRSVILNEALRDYLDRNENTGARNAEHR